MQEEEAIKAKNSSQLKTLKNKQFETEFRENLAKDSEQIWKSSREIRAMLHPTLQEDFVENDQPEVN